MMFITTKGGLFRMGLPLTRLTTRFCSTHVPKDFPRSNTVAEEKEIYKGILSTQIKLMQSSNVALMIGAGTFISFFTFATPLLIHTFAKKYVTRLTYNPAEDAYTAVTYNLFLRPKKITFKVEDVDVPSVPGMFTTFKAHNIPLFIDGENFKENLEHYGKIMGYDKPLNLRWDNDESLKKDDKKQF
ncbi:TMEM70 [Lepeophtheirus salmonis]|uniref:TMEM70 n=1 Tax=Lepeophtheirus salmonis TaxID=72036 RepID=A0A7R8CUJ7_LEPSM|nr:TMEM70 [Lepeophtheirus salmonis]CAF2937246.1 TMEM70 [Lepeophtheirus salmonis]